jgi:hypothetical protein
MRKLGEPLPDNGSWQQRFHTTPCQERRKGRICGKSICFSKGGCISAAQHDKHVQVSTKVALPTPMDIESKKTQAGGWTKSLMFVWKKLEAPEYPCEEQYIMVRAGSLTSADKDGIM